MAEDPLPFFDELSPLPGAPMLRPMHSPTQAKCAHSSRRKRSWWR